jgi:uracil-DNA glycosylase family 4
MSICDNCTVEFNPIPPFGSNSPQIYFCGEAPGEEEVRQRRPFCGPSGQILASMLDSLGLDESTYRMFNAVACRTQEGSLNRNPTSEEIARCCCHIKKDILNHRPKVIVLLGKSALSAFYPEFQGTMREARQKSGLNFEGIPIVVTYHPSYVLRQGGEKTKAYIDVKEDIRRALQVSEGMDNRSSRDNFEKKVFTVFEVDEFIDYVEKKVRGKSDYIGFDYEGSSLEPLTTSFEPAGFCLSGEDCGAYLVVKSYEDNNLPYLDDKKRKKIADYLLELNNQGNLTVFNLGYEVPATVSVFGVYLDKLQDAMQFCRTLNWTGGLKEIVKLHLYEDSIEDWEELTWKWVDTCNKKLAKFFTEISNRKNIAHKLLYKEIELPSIKVKIRKTDQIILFGLPVWEEDVSEYKTSVEFIYHLSKKVPDFEKIKDTDQAKAKEFVEVIDFLSNLAGESLDVTFVRLEALLKAKCKNEEPEFNFTEIPLKVISDYCILDGIYTARLMKKVKTILDERDIYQVGTYYNEHNYLSCLARSSGTRWNDDRAQDIFLDYERKRIDAFKSFLMSERTVKIKNLNNQDLMNISTSYDIDFLKKFINPESTDAKSREIFSEILVSNRTRICLLAYRLTVEYENDSKSCQKTYPILTKLLEKYREKKIEKEEKFDLSSFYSDIKELMPKMTVFENKLIRTCLTYKLESLDQFVTEELITAYLRILEDDLDGNPEDWYEETRCLFFYKLYKKVSKAITTFVEGSAGRGCVHVINKKDMYEPYPIKLATLKDRQKENVSLKKNEMYLYCPEFKANAAKTKRWTSGFHNLPPISEIRQCIEPKDPDGFIIHYDYSQMELRVLAAFSGDEFLLDAFAKGKDVHKYIASLVFDKPEEEITKEERSFSKNGSFAIVYGVSEEAFAEMFMHGDLKRTKELFKKLFKLLKGAKAWIDEQHKKVYQGSRVVQTLWKDEIFLDTGYGGGYGEKENLGEILRYSVNYPIQSSASTIAGTTISRTNRLLESMGYKSRSFGFVHDASDIHVISKELFDLGISLPDISERIPKEEWGMPVKIDISIGVNSGSQIELSSYDGISPFRKEGKKKVLRCKVEGEKEHIDAFLKNLNKIAKVESEIEFDSEKKIPMKQMFAFKGSSYTNALGSTKQIWSGKLYAEQT